MPNCATVWQKDRRATELAQMEVDRWEIWQIVKEYDLAGWDEGLLVWLRRRG